MIFHPRFGRLLALVAAVLLAAWTVPAAAAVRITFYSKELGTTFPHAFVTMEGTLDRSGERIDVDYGFTAKSVTPAILFGAVKGEVISDHGKSYIRASDKHIILTLSDADYDKVMGVVARWRALPQPSYDLDKRNCVHFVADLAASLGMKVDVPRKLVKKPKSFLNLIAETNRAWLVAHGAMFMLVK
ncbi:MAG TPA: hypothetical protein VH331_10875 [Allosphingosinicella sp.]|jgi:hypothetical protein|nr:hypothetical protein [Allosphingosinicella sp.]